MMNLAVGLCVLIVSALAGSNIDNTHILEQGNNNSAHTPQPTAAVERPIKTIRQIDAQPPVTTKTTAQSVEPVDPPQDLTTPPEIAQKEGREDVVAEPKQSSDTLVFADKSDDEIISDIISYWEGIDTLQGKFFQQAPSGNFSDGEFFIRRPGLLRFAYAPPSPLLIIANGGTVFVRDEELKTTDSYPVRQTPLKFLLRKKIDLKKADIVNIERGVDAVGITLSSRDEDTQGELTLVFSAPELQLIRWAVRDARNGLTIVDLTDIIQDEKLQNSLFRIPETRSPFLKN